MTYFLLLTLQDIISESENDDDIVAIHPKDMVELGLDPIQDSDFIIELAQLYFGKQVKVNSLPDMQTCSACCSVQKREQSYIRI